MSNKTFASTFVNGTAVICANGRSEIVLQSSAEFDDVVAAIKRNDYEAAFAAFDKAETIRRKSQGGFQVSSGIVFRNGIPVHNVITRRIFDFAGKNLPFQPLFEFLKNLHENTSKRAVDELYQFLEHAALGITADGCFIGYKSIGADGKSKTSGSEDVEVSTDGGKTWKVYRGRIPNEVGSIVRMKRNCVDEDKNRHCSYGLHVGALEYAGPGGFFNSPGDRVVVVKVNPKNAVSVPADHNAMKLRVCEYEVVANFQKPLTEPLVSSNAAPFATTVKKVDNSQTNFRCKSCRKRKKASTFSGARGKRQKCPRCGSRNVRKL